MYCNVNFMEWSCVIDVFPDWQWGVVSWVSQICLMQKRHFKKLKPTLRLVTLLFFSLWLYHPAMPAMLVSCSFGCSVSLSFLWTCWYLQFLFWTQQPLIFWVEGWFFFYTPKPWLDHLNERCHNTWSLLPFHWESWKNRRLYVMFMPHTPFCAL